MFEVDFDRYLVRLRLRAGVRFHFNHGGVLMGLVCRALGTHDLPAGLMPYAPESGCVEFRAGDPYHFGLTVAGPSRATFDPARLREGLARIGASRPQAGLPAPTLAGNFDLLTLDALPPPDLEAELALCRDAPLTLRFTSPLRMERPEELKLKGAGFLNGECFPPAHFMERLAARLFLLTHGRYPQAHEREEFARGLPLSASPAVKDCHLWWLDLPLEGGPEKRDTRPKGYTTGGVVGQLTLEDVPEGWLAPLVLGQYLHAGEKTHYGLGRYQIAECAPAAPSSAAFRPARSALRRLADPQLVSEAVAHVVANSTAAGADGCTPSDYAGLEDSLAEQLCAEVAAGDYRPAPLLGFVAPKRDGRLRPLVVPTVRDRALQRAACAVLGPAVETLLEDCSYAYRKGFSRAGAARAVERAYDEGFRYVLDADIKSFFDAVEWPRLFAKLDALFPGEPLVALVRQWVAAPVRFEGATVERERGLPQGSAVAPLLANLYLDELDEELLGRDYRLVRYGDDFIVLCKDLETARAARDDARRKLSEMGLLLSEEKTRVRSFEEGFDYLGYLFCRALVLERKAGAGSLGVDLSPQSIPALSWLARVPFERVRALVRQQDQRARGSVSVAASPVAPEPLAPVSLTPPASLQPLAPSEGLRAARPLYLTSHETTVRREGETISVCAPGREPLSIPVRALSHVVCYGRVRLTVPGLLALAERGVPVYFCRATGALKATFGPSSADWTVWMAQARAAEDEALRIRFAREVVAAKLHNYAALAVRFGLARADEAAGELRELERACVNKTTAEALLGLEGRGAARYFAAMRETLAPEWGFEGRRTQPPPDPFNAMLSYGYTVLYNHISTTLQINGLNPRVGLFHTERGAYHALACDLQEEFRHLADAQAWAMVNRSEVKPSDFHASEDGRYPCLMGQELRRKFIAAFEKRLSGEFTPPDGEKISYREFMETQARQLRDYVCGRVALYRPLRTRGR